MKNLVILGAGTGGTLAANMFSNRLNLKEWAISVIDKADEHVYQPGLIFIPFRLYDYERREDITKAILEPLPKNLSFHRAEIKLIDHERKMVKTSNGTYPYDWLVSAMGCRVAPEEIEGMQETLGNGAHTFYTLDGALALQKSLDDMREGRLVINIAELPIKCPVAPIEFAFLADYYFHLKGIRDKVEIDLVTPMNGAFTKPMANKVLTKIAKDKGINVVPNFTIEKVDSDNKTISSYEGQTVDYDLLCAIPPNLGPDVLDESGLGDGSGYALTHPRTLKSRKTDCVYVLGDNSNVSTSKAGSVTHFEADTVVENIMREIDGESPLPSFDGHSNCFIESGYNKALLIDFNYDMEPVPGTFPLPGMGPFSLLKESHINHMGKLAFKWTYWNMLLPGRMAHVPLLPSHMSFVGKDLSSVPQVRHSKAMEIAAVMSSDVITVTVGTSLTDAARKMTEHGVSGLPVVDVDDKLVGVITEADFLSALDIKADSAVQRLFDIVIRRNRTKKPMGTIVDDLMTRNPITIKPNDTLQTAINRMDKNRVKRLFITDSDDRVQGVVSRADLMKLFVMTG